MPRHQFTPEERRRGGLTRSQQPSFVDACRKGFENVFITHPFFARKWLKKKIKAYNQAKQETKGE